MKNQITLTNETESKIKAIHTIEYLRYETAMLRKYAKSNSTEKSDDALLAAFERVLEFVEDCNEDYLEEVGDF